MKSKSLIWLAATAFLGACGSGTGPAGTRVSLSLSGGAPGPNLAVVAADTMRDGQNELILSSIEIVLREIGLKRVDVVDCDVEPEPEGCEKFETAAILATIPLDGSTQQVFNIEIDPGEYDRVEFNVHKVSDDVEDAAFRAQYPDLVGTSVRVRGSYNGTEFTFTSDLNEKQEFQLVPPITVTDGTATNVTLHLDLSDWFTDASGALVDPVSGNKGGINENMVIDNIRTSIDVFEDGDRDGSRG